MYEVWHRRLDNWDLENAGWVIIIYNWVITLDSAFGTPFGILINSILYWWNNVADGFVRWVKLVMPEAKIIKWRHSSKGIKRVIQAKTLRHRQLTLALQFARSREFQDIQMKAFKQSNQRHSSKQRYAWRHSSKDSQAKLFKQRHPSEQSYSSNRRHSSKAIQTTPVDGFDICTNLRLGIATGLDCAAQHSN